MYLKEKVDFEAPTALAPPTTEADTIVGYLENARLLLQEGWCKHRFIAWTQEGQRAYCVVGAVAVSQAFDVERFDNDFVKIYCSAPVELLWRALQARSEWLGRWALDESLPDSLNVASFNNHALTTQQDVLALIDDAIALARAA